MTRDQDRINRVTALMRSRGFDALLCHRPHNVLMLSGYLPVLGQSLVIFLSDGDGVVIAPECESDYARDGWYSEIRTFSSVTPDYVLSPLSAADPLLAEVCCEKGISSGVIGVEYADGSIPSCGPTIYIPGWKTIETWRQMFPHADVRDATELLIEAESIKTSREIERITVASRIARYGMEAARNTIRNGVREVEIAASAKMAIETYGTGMANVRRLGSWVSCASGPRSAHPGIRQMYSTNRRLDVGDTVAVEVICHADGYWTHITRTFFLDEPSPEQRAGYTTVLNAWEAALSVLGEGGPASRLDSAIRSALIARGLEEPHGHAAGLGIGFRPPCIDVPPTVHTRSKDLLYDGVVFALRPAVHVANRLGISLGDVVCVRGDQGVVLSDLRRDIEWATCNAA